MKAQNHLFRRRTLLAISSAFPLLVWCCSSSEILFLDDFCGSTNTNSSSTTSTLLAQVQSYMNDAYFRDRRDDDGNSSSSSATVTTKKVLSNNGTGFQCHCDFFGEFVECRLWTRDVAVDDCQFCPPEQETVVTERLQFNDTTTTISSSSSSKSNVAAGPLYFERCGYGGTRDDDRARSPNRTIPYGCERLEVSSSAGDGTTLRDCSYAGIGLDCEICPEGTGTNLTYVHSNGTRLVWKSRCRADNDKKENGGGVVASTQSLLYQFHLNVRPLWVILADGDDDDGDNNCDEVEANDGGETDPTTPDDYCADLSDVELSFDGSLERRPDFLFSSSTLVDGFACACDYNMNNDHDPEMNPSSIRVSCVARYLGADASGDLVEYTMLQETILTERQNDGYYVIQSMGSCDRGECHTQEMDYTGSEIVLCMEKNNTVTAAFCELCPDQWYHADSLSYSQSCDENAFTVNPFSYFLRYRGLRLGSPHTKGPDCRPEATSSPTASATSSAAPILTRGCCYVSIVATSSAWLAAVAVLLAHA